FPKEQNTDPAFQQNLARAHGRLGDIQEMLGNAGKAEPAYTEAVDLLKVLTSKIPNSRKLERELARDFNNRGVLRRKENRFGEAEEDLQQALSIRLHLAQESPS